MTHERLQVYVQAMIGKKREKERKRKEKADFTTWARPSWILLI